MDMLELISPRDRERIGKYRQALKMHESKARASAISRELDIPYSTVRYWISGKYVPGRALWRRRVDLKRLEVNLPHDVEQLLIASLLGDGSIVKDGRGFNFKEAHAIKQASYLRWKAGILSEHFGGRVSERFLSNGSRYVEYCSNIHPIFVELRRCWYPEGKKRIPEHILKKLDLLALYVWYCDDGWFNYWTRTCCIGLHDFKDQAESIRNHFCDRGFTCWLLHSNPAIVFSRKSTDRFLREITANVQVHECMKYKFGHLFPENHQRLEEVAQKRRERDKVMQKKKYYCDLNYRKRIIDRKKEWRKRKREERN